MDCSTKSKPSCSQPSPTSWCRVTGTPAERRKRIGLTACGPAARTRGRPMADRVDGRRQVPVGPRLRNHQPILLLCLTWSARMRVQLAGLAARCWHDATWAVQLAKGIIQRLSRRQCAVVILVVAGPTLARDCAADASSGSEKKWACIHTFTADGTVQEHECVCAYLDLSEDRFVLADRCTVDVPGPNGICCATLPTAAPEPSCTCSASSTACREWEPRQVTDCAQANKLSEWR